MILADSSLEASALSTAMGYLAQRSTVCAKILDRDGKVMAINKRGLELLNVDAETICGQVWTTFWDGAERDKAEATVRSAFEGKPASFIGAFTGPTTGESIWEVEIVPLDWQDGEVNRVLALSSLMVGQAPGGNRSEQTFEDRKMLTSLSELFHTLSNLTAVTTSAANILRRGVDPERAETLADALTDAGEKAAAAVDSLRAQIGSDKKNEGKAA